MFKKKVGVGGGMHGHWWVVVAHDLLLAHSTRGQRQNVVNVCTEVVYPTDHDFIFFKIGTLLKTFFINI